MRKIWRIAIATVVSILVLFISISFMIVIFKIEAPKIGAILTIGAWIFTYKIIKPSKKELERKETRLVEYHHPNGLIREKGKMVAGKKEGEWDIFNENGEYFETNYYENGEFRYSRKAEQ